MSQGSSSNNNSSQFNVSEAAKQAALDALNAGANEVLKKDSTGEDVVNVVGSVVGGVVGGGVVIAAGGSALSAPASVIGGVLGAKLGKYFYNKINELLQESQQHREQTGKYLSDKQAFIVGAIAGPVGAAIAVATNAATAKRPKSAPLRKGNAGQFRDDIKRGVVPKMSSSDNIGSQSITTANNNHTKSQGKG